MAKETWTPEADELALKMYHAGETGEEIALAVSRILRPVSAKAVFARINRLKETKPRPASYFSFWTEQRIELLRKYWEEGLSCNQIANRLGGGCSRNAVIGKVHRLKLPDRVITKMANGGTRRAMGNGKVSYKTKPPKPLTQVRKIAQLIAEPLPPVNENDVARVKSLFDLEPHHCRWPVDVEGQKWPGYCGDHKVIGLSYCANHVRRAFSVGQSRQSKVAAEEVAAHKHQKESVDA